MQNMSATSQNSGGNTMDQAQSGHANGNDWREEVFQKIKSMKDMYFSDMNDMSQKIAAKLQQHDSLQQPKTEQLEKLKLFKAMLDRAIAFLQLNKSNIVIGHKDKLPLYEKQIVSFVSSNSSRKPVSSLQPGLLPQPHMQSMQQPQSQIYQVQSHTTETGHANGNDWREEVFQKIKSMKDMYFSDMNDMSQKIAAKLQQHDSLQQPKTEQLEKLKLFKAMLDRAIAFLQLNKSNIVIGHKDKLPLYEKQIVSFVSSNSSRKPVSSLQPGLLPQPHMQSMQRPQSQIYQVQSHTTETGHANGNDWKGEVYQRNIQNSSGVQTSASLSSALPSASSLAQTSVPSVIGQKRNLQNMSATSQNSGGNIMVQASLDSTAQTGHANGGDWKEEVYQKIKSMKEIYFADLDDMSQKIAVKLQEHDSLQQPKTEQLEKLKLFKAMLDRTMAFLQLNKSNIVIGHKDKLPLYEKRIGSFVIAARTAPTTSCAVHAAASIS